MTLADIAPSTKAPAKAETVLLRTRRLGGSLVEVTVGEEVVGFLEFAGGVWVALCGPVYSWATEVGQHMDPDLAVLALFTGGPRPTASTGLPHGGGPRLYRERQLRQRVGRA